MKNQYTTKSASETKKIAKQLAKEILKSKLLQKAVVLALEGDLGGGKTTFIQGFAKGLGIKAKILSPTFVIRRKFQIQSSKFLNGAKRRISWRVACQINPKCQNKKFNYFYHFDCYRIQNSKELLVLGFKEIVLIPQNIIAIEWADRVKKIIPKPAIKIKFDFIDQKRRKITIS